VNRTHKRLHEKENVVPCIKNICIFRKKFKREGMKIGGSCSYQFLCSYIQRGNERDLCHQCFAVTHRAFRCVMKCYVSILFREHCNKTDYVRPHKLIRHRAALLFYVYFEINSKLIYLYYVHIRPLLTEAKVLHRFYTVHAY
jgi:hypothetical protein